MTTFTRFVFYTLVFAHFLIVLGNTAALFVLPLMEPWYIALPLMSFLVWHATSRTADCPLTRMENALRRHLGMKQIGGFIGHYMIRPVKYFLGIKRRPTVDSPPDEIRWEGTIVYGQHVG